MCKRDVYYIEIRKLLEWNNQYEKQNSPINLLHDFLIKNNLLDKRFINYNDFLSILIENHYNYLCIDNKLIIETQVNSSNFINLIIIRDFDYLKKFINQYNLNNKKTDNILKENDKSVNNKLHKIEFDYWTLSWSERDRIPENKYLFDTLFYYINNYLTVSYDDLLYLYKHLIFTKEKGLCLEVNYRIYYKCDSKRLSLNEFYSYVINGNKKSNNSIIIYDLDYNENSKQIDISDLNINIPEIYIPKLQIL